MRLLSRLCDHFVSSIGLTRWKHPFLMAYAAYFKQIIHTFFFPPLIYMVLNLFWHSMSIYRLSSSDMYGALSSAFKANCEYYKCVQNRKLPYIRAIYFVVASLRFRFSISWIMTTTGPTQKQCDSNSTNKTKQSGPCKPKKNHSVAYWVWHSRTLTKINEMFMWRRALCAYVDEQSTLHAKCTAQITYFISSFQTVVVAVLLATIFWHTWAVVCMVIVLKCDRGKSANNPICISDLYGFVFSCRQMKPKFVKNFSCSTSKTSVCRFGCAVFYRFYFIYFPFSSPSTWLVLALFSFSFSFILLQFFFYQMIK